MHPNTHIGASLLTLLLLRSLAEVPDSITVDEFLNNEKYGRYPIAKARHPYTCGITGKTRSAAEVKERTELAARAIGNRLGFGPHEGTEWDRVVALYSLNSVSVRGCRE